MASAASGPIHQHTGKAGAWLDCYTRNLHCFLCPQCVSICYWGQLQCHQIAWLIESVSLHFYCIFSNTLTTYWKCIILYTVSKQVKVTKCWLSSTMKRICREEDRGSIGHKRTSSEWGRHWWTLLSLPCYFIPVPCVKVRLTNCAFHQPMQLIYTAVRKQQEGCQGSGNPDEPNETWKHSLDLLAMEKQNCFFPLSRGSGSLKFQVPTFFRKLFFPQDPTFFQNLLPLCCLHFSISCVSVTHPDRNTCPLLSLCNNSSCIHVKINNWQTSKQVNG